MSAYQDEEKSMSQRPSNAGSQSSTVRDEEAIKTLRDSIIIKEEDDDDNLSFRSIGKI
jgi:hypothetical protein